MQVLQNQGHNARRGARHLVDVSKKYFRKLISYPMKSKSLLIVFLFILAGRALGAAPTITSFSPGSGPVGTLVTITGTNLSSPTAFSMGGATAIVVSNTGTQLVGLVMPGAVTECFISVTTTSKLSPPIAPIIFVITPPTNAALALLQPDICWVLVILISLNKEFLLP